MEYGEIPRMMAVRKLNERPGLEFVEVETPKVGDGSVLVKVAGCGICGSDRHILNWEGGQSPKTKPPVTLGHEVSGTVIKLGAGVSPRWKNTGVVLESVIRDKDWFLGINVDGGLAPYVAVPEQALHLAPSGLPLEIAGALEPATTGFKAARKAKDLIEFRKIDNPSVVVLGATGMIGAAAALASSFYGLETWAVGRRSSIHLLNLVDPTIKTVDTSVQDLKEAIQSPAIVIETVGTPESYMLAMEIVRQGGIFVDVGLHEKKMVDASLFHNPGVRKELLYWGIYARDAEDWEFARKNVGIGTDKIDISPFIDRLPLESYMEALAGKGEGYKTILLPS